MYLARITRLEPLPGREAEVEQMADGLLTWLGQQEGYVAGMRLVSLDNPADVSWISIWDSRAAADAAVNSQHALSVYSQIITMAKGRAVSREQFEVRNEIGLPVPKVKSSE